MILYYRTGGGIEEAGDGVPTLAEKNARAIVSKYMTGTKEMVVRGRERCGGGGDGGGGRRRGGYVVQTRDSG